jgi:hypothetical protein
MHDKAIAYYWLLTNYYKRKSKIQTKFMNFEYIPNICNIHLKKYK